MAEKEFKHEDPFELVQMYMDIPADDSFYQQMTTTFVEEYMRLGWSDEDIFGLFQDPYYRGTYDILQKNGAEFVKNIIHEVRHG